MRIEPDFSIACISAHGFRSTVLDSTPHDRALREELITDIMEIWTALFIHQVNHPSLASVEAMIDGALELKTQITRSRYVYRFAWADWGLCATRCSQYLNIDDAGSPNGRVVLCLFPSFIRLDEDAMGERSFKCLVKGLVRTESNTPINICLYPVFQY